MADRIHRLGASVFRRLEPEDFPQSIAHITRMWAELYEADPHLALELARKLPSTEIRRHYKDKDAKKK